MLKSFFATIMLISTVGFAQTTYDYKTGNSYTKMGNTTYGTNTRTGSTWSTTTNGSQSYGTDSKGNYWSSDSKTGNYYNTNGKTCTGKGYARVCN